jgi:competence protein ComEC
VPRAAWLAVGAAAAALGADSVAVELLPLVVVMVAGAASTLLAVARLARVRAAKSAAFAAVGASVVLIHVLVVVVARPAGTTAEVPTDDVDWRGEVVSLSSASRGTQPALLLLTPDGAVDTSAPGIRVWAQLPRYPQVVPGDRLAFHAAVEPPERGTGFADYLDRIGAVGVVRVREARLTEDGARSPVEALRRSAGAMLARTLPSPQSGLAAGILVGLRDQVDRDVAADFTTAGLSHVVAISGWNICIVAGCLAAMLRRLGRRPRSVLTVLAIVAYTLIAGASPSVVRAALMASVVILARETGRPGTAATALGLAAFAMLAVDPATVADAGFQLSVVATAGLLVWATPLTDLLRRHLLARVPGWLIESLGVSLAAQMATLPIVVVSFGRLSLIAPAANLVMAPLVAPAMAAGLACLVLAAIAAAGVPGLIVLPATLVAALLFGAMVAVARVSAALPLASVELEPAAALVVAGVATAALGFLGTAGGRRALGAGLALARRRPSLSARPTASIPVARTAAGAPARSIPKQPLAVLAVVAVLVFAVVAGRPDGRFRMTVLDVGQGDAILLEGGRGGRILVDAGPDPDRLLALLDARLPPWDRRLDLVVITHPHEDHVAGVALLLERYRVGSLAEPGMRGRGPGYVAYAAALAELGTKSVRLQAGDELSLDGASILVRWPRPGTVPDEPADEGRAVNNVSIVLDVSYGAHRMLLAGDVEDDIDPELLRDGLAGDRPVDVLKVAHHGSRTATTGPLLDALTPRVALVSAGSDNRYGHPDPDTLSRLEGAGARVLRTDTDGSVTVTSDGSTLSVAATGGRPAPPKRRGEAPTNALLTAAQPRIGEWPSPTDAPRPIFSCSFEPPNGSSRMSAGSPRSPRSSRGARPLTNPSTSSSSPRPPSFMTWTSSSAPTTRSRGSDTARPELVGWMSRDIASLPLPSVRIRSSGSVKRATTRRGRRRSASPSASSRTRTSGSVSG